MNDDVNLLDEKNLNSQALSDSLIQEEIILSSPDDSSSGEISELSKKGYSYLKDNRLSDAISAFSQILVLEENNNYALVGLGDSERKQGHYKAAIEYYSRCLACHPGNNYALFGMADCYKALNQYHKAI